jgi:hypothetical protein
VLSAAAAEITQRLDSTVIDVRLSGGEPEFVITAVQPCRDEPATGSAPESAADEAGTARVTLRLSEPPQGQDRSPGRGRGALGERLARARGHQGA